jgi:hypothetical protein
MTFVPHSIGVSRRKVMSRSASLSPLPLHHPKRCLRCHATRFWTCRGGSKVVYDLKFTRRGIKRQAVRYCYNKYRCSECRAEMTTYSHSSQYGPSLRAFLVYLLVELRLSNQKAAEHASSLFELPLKKS